MEGEQDLYSQPGMYVRTERQKYEKTGKVVFSLSEINRKLSYMIIRTL